MSFFERLRRLTNKVTNKFNFDTVLKCVVGVQVFNLALTCLTIKKTHFDVKQPSRGVEELDKEVESLSYDVRTLKAKLQDCLAFGEKQKRELLVLKADTNEKVDTLESTVQDMHSKFKWSVSQDGADKSLHA